MQQHLSQRRRKLLRRRRDEGEWGGSGDPRVAMVKYIHRVYNYRAIRMKFSCRGRPPTRNSPVSGLETVFCGECQGKIGRVLLVHGWKGGGDGVQVEALMLKRIWIATRLRLSSATLKRGTVPRLYATLSYRMR